MAFIAIYACMYICMVLGRNKPKYTHNKIASCIYCGFFSIQRILIKNVLTPAKSFSILMLRFLQVKNEKFTKISLKIYAHFKKKKNLTYFRKHLISVENVNSF